MLLSICLLLAERRNHSFKLSFWLKKLSFAFLLGGLCFTLPPTVRADTLKTLQLQWSYDTSIPGLAGYRIYHDGTFLDEIDDPSALSVTLNVLLAAGNNNFTMTAIDVNGNESAQSSPYVVDNTLANQPPTAVIQADVLSGEAPLTVAFDGTASSDPDGTIVKYFWDTGDGASNSADFFSYTFLASGTYTVQLTVTDDQGATATSTVVITVTDPVSTANLAPTAVLDASVQAGTAPLTVSFDGSWSNDPDGSIASYQWDFGDGQISSGARVSHDFMSAGDYTVTLTVTDNGGATATAAQTISVTAPIPNQPPNATIQASAFSGEAPLAVTFDGSGSSDADGTVVNYQWDFGDGGSASGSMVSHSFANPGTYTIILTVTDDQGAVGSASAQVDVTAPATQTQTQTVNNAPVANDDSVVVGQDSDILVNVLSNDQDADGDSLSIIAVGQPSDGVATIEANAIRYIPNPGYHGKDGFSYTISDGNGGTATAQVNIRVSPVNSNNGNSGHGKP